MQNAFGLENVFVEKEGSVYYLGLMPSSLLSWLLYFYLLGEAF